MSFEDFIDVKDLASKIGPLNMKSLKMTEVKILQIRQKSPSSVFYKNSFAEKEFKEAKMFSKKPPAEKNITPRPAFASKPQIQENKKNYLWELVQKNHIPKVGDKLPNIELYENTPGNKVSIHDVIGGKKVVLFGVPGAFIPGCSKTHLGGYVREADNLKDHGIGEIVCIAVNDAFVCNAWARDTQAEGKIRILSDPQASFTKAIELTTEISVLGGVRSMRYSMLLDDGVIKALNVEPDGTGLSCSLAEHMKDKLRN